MLLAYVLGRGNCIYSGGVLEFDARKDVKGVSTDEKK